MNGTRASLDEARAIARAGAGSACDVVLCPPATLLAAMSALEGLAVGGQDCHAAASGAHTGDISAAMLVDAGATYVIVGHSERRADHGETSLQVRAKAEAALAAGLTPIVCIGETLEDRDAGRTLAVLSEQLSGSIPEGEVVVAYEPVWAIGTGRVASPDQIAQAHAHIRAAVGPDTPILYGGSVKAGNAAEIFAVAEVDGALVGGASLTAADFVPIVEALDGAEGGA
ncbi:MAG: triose-phosphate isomerase [Paracoccaceae bacterium]